MKNLGIIGFGNMGSTLAKMLKSRKYKVWIFDKDKDRIGKVKGFKRAEGNIDLVERSDTVILAVKPQDFSAVLDEIKEYVKVKLIISIAAGITTGFIEKYLGEVSIIRTMPNMPAKIGRGITCLCRGKFSSAEDLNFTRQLFNNLGETLILDEDRMDMATAISGSGPGYCYDLIQTQNVDINSRYAVEKFKEGFTLLLAGAAVSIGFKPQYAMILAKATASGSIGLLKKTKSSPEELKRQITSKGGTTEAALKVLHRGESLEQAVKAALLRAKELSRK